mmetsp:Transcript_13130/g.27130  ORF Transcript_13130/g.27130 Transcript_13130/m.27130 type:complete len:229 (+) Transcript_13130:139-825(+)
MKTPKGQTETSRKSATLREGIVFASHTRIRPALKMRRTNFSFPFPSYSHESNVTHQAEDTNRPNCCWTKKRSQLNGNKEIALSKLDVGDSNSAFILRAPKSSSQRSDALLIRDQDNASLRPPVISLMPRPCSETKLFLQSIQNCPVEASGTNMFLSNLSNKCDCLKSLQRTGNGQPPSFFVTPNSQTANEKKKSSRKAWPQPSQQSRPKTGGCFTPSLLPNKILIPIL